MNEDINNFLILRSYYAVMDKDFIFSTLMKGLYFGNNDYRKIDKETFLKNYQKILDNVFEQGVSVNILALKEDPRVIVSYCVYKDDKIIWVHTKRDWRNMKLTRLIVPKCARFAVHLSKPGRAILEKHPEIKYDPFF